MFLLDKYQWLKIFNECPTMIEYLSDRPSVNEVVKDTADWLLELFSYGHQYDRESIKMFERHPELFEDFVLHEIFDEDGTIEVVCPPEMSKYDRSTYEFVTAFFLFFRHNKMLPESLRGDLEREVRRFFSSLLYRISNSDLRDKEHAVRFLEPLSRLVREKFFKTSFVYNVSPRQQYTYNGKYYRVDDSDCVRLELNVVFRDDRNRQETFGEYINYLLLQERNRIVDFRSSASFWDSVVRLKRERDPYLMEQRPVADKDLLLFSLALALSKPVYERLKDLRDKTSLTMGFKGYPAGHVIDSTVPVIDSSTKYRILGYLDDSYWLLSEARKRTTGERQIPREILRIANINLLKDDCRPIIHLFGTEEVEELKSSAVPEKKWRAFYDEKNADLILHS